MLRMPVPVESSGTSMTGPDRLALPVGESSKVRATTPKRNTCPVALFSEMSSAALGA